MTSEVKTEARFGLSGPSYPMGLDFKAVIGLAEPLESQSVVVIRPHCNFNYLYLVSC